MIKELIKLATHLDTKGLRKEADYLDAVIKKTAADRNYRKTAHSHNDPDSDSFLESPWDIKPADDAFTEHERLVIYLAGNADETQHEIGELIAASPGQLDFQIIGAGIKAVTDGNMSEHDAANAINDLIGGKLKQRALASHQARLAR